jgi:hypothetical protein
MITFLLFCIASYITITIDSVIIKRETRIQKIGKTNNYYLTIHSNNFASNINLNIKDLSFYMALIVRTYPLIWPWDEGPILLKWPWYEGTILLDDFGIKDLSFYMTLIWRTYSLRLPWYEGPILLDDFGIKDLSFYMTKIIIYNSYGYYSFI